MAGAQEARRRGRPWPLASEVVQPPEQKAEHIGEDRGGFSVRERARCATRPIASLDWSCQCCSRLLR